MSELVRRESRHRDRRTVVPSTLQGSRQGQDGAIVRALLWVIAGVLLAVIAFVAITPEIASDEPRVAVELIGLVSVAAIPGLALLVFAAIRRARLGLDDPGADPGNGWDELTGTDRDRTDRDR